MTLYLEEFEVAKLVHEVAATVQPLITKNGNTLVVECPADIGTMRADVTKVRQTLFNLLSNASKFTETRNHATGGKIEYSVISIRPQWQWLRVRVPTDTELCTLITFRVTDTGIGMTPEQMSRHLRGLLPGRRLDDAEVRRHRARAGDQPEVLPDDGRRHHRRRASLERAPPSPSRCPRK